MHHSTPSPLSLRLHRVCNALVFSAIACLLCGTIGCESSSSALSAANEAVRARLVSQRPMDDAISLTDAAKQFVPEEKTEEVVEEDDGSADDATPDGAAESGDDAEADDAADLGGADESHSATVNPDARIQMTLIGKVGSGSFSGIEPNRAVVMLSEAPDDHGQGDDHPDDCPFCKKKLANAPTAQVTFVTQDGATIPVGVDKLFGLAAGKIVQVRGEVQFNRELKLLSVKADQVAVIR
ncbi:MAG: hypothetical protein AAFP90_24175 [Planctomycetota bacterium]